MKIPLYNELTRYSKKRNSSFHTPGHKNGKLFQEFGFKKPFQDGLFSTDLSVSCPTIDSLHEPKGVIKEAQELAAKAFGSKETLFVTGGSTLSNLISIFGVFSKKDKVIVSRNMHKSVLNGIILRDLEPVFVPIDYKNGIPLNCSSEVFKKTLENNEDTRGAIITSPSYDGITTNTRKIAGLLHSKGLPLIVDEAWGAHLHFSSQFPESAMAAGADIAVQSTHKTLGALSQGSMIHFNSKIVDFEKIRESYNCFTTTSPNYTILSSLDISRHIMEKHGKFLADRLFSIARFLKEKANSLDSFNSPTSDFLKGTEFGLDESKVTVFNNCETGKNLSANLKKSGIQVEKFDENGVLFLLTCADKKEDVEKILSALQKIDKKYMSSEWASALIPSKAIRSKKEEISIDNSLNRICAESITPYPPGIPLVLPGEILTEKIVGFLKNFRGKNTEIHGIRDKSLKRILVVKNNKKAGAH